MSNLDRALRKVKYYPTMHQWGGCLTPSEIVALVDAGAISSASSEWEMKWVRDKLAKGESRPTWFYFTARKQMVPLLPKRDNKKVGTAEKL